MEKPTFKNGFIILLLLLLSSQLFAQNYVPYTPRYDAAIKGDMLLIGNSNLGRHRTNPYNGDSPNNNINNMVNVDIDSDGTTFNSSSADLAVPNTTAGCYQVSYAGLYWSAVVAGNSPIEQVKFRPPGGSYIDITGEEIYFQNASNDNNSNTYAYYADVTGIISGLTSAEGTYTVANISSRTGNQPNAEGLSAGWSLFVIYEDPTATSKYITSFDGFTRITGDDNATFPISGFRTIPIGPVRAKYAFSTIEGDGRYTGDYLRINGTNISSTNSANQMIRPTNNFFNSTVSIIDPVTNTPETFTDRNPASTNTLGFDSGIIPVPNAGNSLINNGATSANITLGSNLDRYYFYFNAFSIEIIAPNVVITKIVEDTNNVDIGGQLVNLGDELYYTIGFQNTGNDDATGLIIRDILPANIVFNYPSDLGVLPAGVTVQSYNPTTREIVFAVDDSVVEQGDPVSEIRFMVTVVSSCSLLTNACDNSVNNQAFATYQGTVNSTFTITDDPSLSTNTGCNLIPTATNFLANLNQCTYEEEVILCGGSTVLTAGNGYDSYSWSTSPSGTPVIGTGQSITVTNTGTYYVRNTAIAPCQSISQVFNVITYGANVPDPIAPFADEIVTCPNDGRSLSNIYLCGANDSTNIITGITDSSSMVWERLDEGSCAAVTPIDCPNEDPGCTWNQVQTGANYLVEADGQYRLTVNYAGGCFNQYYFNVYENVFNATASAQDIICTTPGEITVENVPSGYEFSLDNTTFQTSNVLSITTPNLYTVYIRQMGVSPNPCVFTVPNIQVRARNFTVTTNVTQPLCSTDLGSVVIAANDVEPQYSFSISRGGTLVNSVGPITDNNYTFDNLSPGIYTYNVSTDDGCVDSGTFEIIVPDELTATSAITAPLTCRNGEITIYPVGGTPPYSYFVNSTTVFQSVPTIDVSTGGTYNVTVVDFNNCTVDTSITIDPIPAPEFSISETDILCVNSGGTGTIDINVTNAHGNSLEYSIDNGNTFSTSPNFTGLAATTYNVVVRYTYGTDVCLTTAQPVTIDTVDPITGTASVTAPYTCTTTGEITVSGVTGGTAPYEYSLDGLAFQSGLVFTGLTNGTYTVTIRDANGCSLLTTPITIDGLNPVTDLTFASSPLACPANVSTVDVTAVGSVAPLEYQITAPASAATAFQTSNSFAGLAPDTYTFQVRDANNCLYSESFTIAPLPPVTVNAVLTKDLDCTASPDANIQFEVTSGVAPFTYVVSFNGSPYPTNPTAQVSITSTPPVVNYSVATPGTYQFLITDANGCTAESAVQTVSPISLPEITSVVETQSILCNSDNTAAIDITINNTVGTAPFVINVFNNTTSVNFGTQTSGLPAGDYTITLTDSKSCTDTETITIAQPDPIVSNPIAHDMTCVGPNVTEGAIEIPSVTGGTAPYDYFLTSSLGYSDSSLGNSGATPVSFTVGFGIYQVNIIDANGCSVLVQNLSVASPVNNLGITITSFSDCTTGGTIDVSVDTAFIGSTGPFYFDIYRGTVPPAPPGGSWNLGTGTNNAQFQFTSLTPGVTYTFIVYDAATQCSYFETHTAPVPTNSTLTVNSFVANNVTCRGSADGNVAFNINSLYGTNTDVSYEIFDALSLNTTGISGTGTVPAVGTLPVTNLGPLAPGSYYVLVTETSGPNVNCSIATVNFNIIESAQDLVITANLDSNANCNPNSGVVSASASFGTGPYEFQLTNSATAPLATDPSWGSANNFNVGAGTYFAHVKDAFGCIRSTAAVVVGTDPEPVVAAALNTQCNIDEGNFVIDVTLPTAGIAPYSYSIDGGAFQTLTAPFSITNLSSGTHTVEVQDANGCGNMVSVDVFAPLGLTPDVTAEPTCNDDDGVITITGIGGSGTYAYAISPMAPSVVLTGNVFSGLPSGAYTVTITDSVTLCTDEVQVTLPQVAPFTFTTTPTTVACFGDTGTFEINVNGYTGPYTYDVLDNTSTSIYGTPVSANTSTNPEVATGVPAGTFTVVVTATNSPFCSVTSSVVINSPSAPLTVTATETSNVTCDDNRGTITAVANGGWGTYEYELTGAATVAYSSNGTFTGLSAGNYTVNVRDAGGCIASDPIILSVPTPITATVTVTPSVLACYGDTNASINVTGVTGGQGSNYFYVLNMISPTVTSSGPQASPDFDNLGVGTYTVEIIDGYNCTFVSAPLTITQPNPIVADLVMNTAATCLADGTLTLSATGGTGTYSYSDTSTFTTTLGTFTSSVVITVSPGTYSYYVRDANGCVANVSNEITIEPIPTLSVNLVETNVTINCAGDNTGVIEAEAQGGLGNYIYTLLDGVGNPISPAPVQTTPGLFTDLAAGSYQVRVESGVDCTATESVTITEPSSPLTADFTGVTDVTCNGANDGMLEIIASGGTGIIKYAISPRLDQFFESPIFTDLGPGTYQAIAQDELGCFVVENFVIVNEPAPIALTVIPGSIVPEICQGDLTGAFSVDITGGIAPYSVVLDDINGTYTPGAPTQTQFDFTGLSGGDHIVYIRDNQGCESEWNVTFPESVLLDPVAVVEYGCTNNLSNNTVTVTVDSSISNLADVTYSLNGGPYQASNVFLDVPAGIGHYIDVMHVNTCVQQTEPFDIAQVDPLELVLEDGGLNEIVSVSTGGSGGYDYTLNGEPYGNTSSFIIYESGDYTVTVTDSNGCVATATRYFEYIDVCIPNYFTPNGDGVRDEWGPGCTINYTELNVEIFDRYGRKVGTCKYDKKWDGKYRDAPLPTGDYWYVLKLNDPKDDREFVGHFTLYR